MTYQNLQDENILEPENVSKPLPSVEMTSESVGFPDFGNAPERSDTDKGTWMGSAISGPKGVLLGLALGLGLAFAGVKLSQRETNSGAAPAEEVQVSTGSVTTTQAKSAPIKETIAANGTVEAFDLLSVSPRASGLQILSVTVREGDRVSQGQVLATLDDSILRAQIAQAEAQVIAAQAEVAQREAATTTARAVTAEAQDKYDRYLSLYNQGAISQEELSTRRTQLTTDTESIGSAVAAIDSAKATVRSRQAEVSQLYTQLDQTQVLAPTSGIIAEKSATVGDTASAGTPLFKIISGDQLELAVELPQTQIAKINVGSPVQITSSADSNLQLQGSVRSIDPTVDAASRKATIKVSLPGSDKLRPGMFLQSAITTGSRQGVVIPAESVIPLSSGGFVVYTVSPEDIAKAEAKTKAKAAEEPDGRIEPVPVPVKAQSVDVGDRKASSQENRTTAEGTTTAQIEITNGLNPDALVIVEGASYLQDGDLVTIIQN